MLRELHISNLAVIEDATVDLRGGLNCFTGQTGAGKSLVIGAFELMLGLRSATDLLRQGAEEGRVSGVFELTRGDVVRRVAELADVELDVEAETEQVLITRKLFASGRTSVSINGRPATAAMLREIGELLVDVHGQHDHQYLLKPANQLLMLDRFAETEALRQRFAELHEQLRDLHERKRELEASRTLRQQQLELYEFQAGEIDDAAPTAEEYGELEARHRLLSNLQKIKRDAGAAYAALYESDGAAAERLQRIVAILKDLSDLDEDLKPTVEELANATAIVQDAAFSLGRYVDRLDLDPGELEEVEQRLNTLNRLVQKYGSSGRLGGGSVEDVIAYRGQIEQEIERLRHDREDLQTIEQQIAPLIEQRQKIGEELSEKRKAAAGDLEPLVEAQLAELGMAEAKFEVAFDRPAEGEDSPTGFDNVEMLVQANPGQPARPLRKVASGGELSRIMLALKTILASSDRISVLVFDEIDANVGGRMGSVLGSKLRDLAAHHQVLCITHLPQIAAHADHHLKIVKQVESGETRTQVEPLGGDRRVDELAEMLTGSGATATTRKQAKELLASAGGPASSKKPATGKKGSRRRKSA